MLRTSLLSQNWPQMYNHHVNPGVTHQDGIAEGLDLGDQERRGRGKTGKVLNSSFSPKSLEGDKVWGWKGRGVAWMSRVPSAWRANGFSLPLKTHKRKIPPEPQASPPLQESVVRRQRDQLFLEHQHHLYISLPSLCNLCSQAFYDSKALKDLNG